MKREALIPCLSLQLISTVQASLKFMDAILWKRSNYEEDKRSISTYTSTPRPTSGTPPGSNPTPNGFQPESQRSEFHDSKAKTYAGIAAVLMILLLVVVLYCVYRRYRSNFILIETQLSKGKNLFNKPWTEKSRKSSSASLTSLSPLYPASSPTLKGRSFGHTKRISFTNWDSNLSNYSSALVHSKSSLHSSNGQSQNYRGNDFEELLPKSTKSGRGRKKENTVIKVILEEEGEEEEGAKEWKKKLNPEAKDDAEYAHLKNELKKIITNPKPLSGYDDDHYFSGNYHQVHKSPPSHRRSQSSPDVSTNIYISHSLSDTPYSEEKHGGLCATNEIGGLKPTIRVLSRVPSISPTPPGYLRSPCESTFAINKTFHHDRVIEEEERTAKETQKKEEKNRSSFLGRGDSYFWKTPSTKKS